MNKLWSTFENKLSQVRDKMSDIVFKERTIDVSENAINKLIQTDEKFSSKLKEKGLSNVRLQVKDNKIVVTGILEKHVKDAAFTVELRPEKIIWTKEEQTIFMKMLDYDLKMEKGGYFNLVKLTMVKMIMAVFKGEKVLKYVNIDTEDDLIKINLKDVNHNIRKVVQSIELKQIQCLPGTLSLTILPRPDIAREHLMLVKDWVTKKVKR
ncbi:MAG: hypothetical protein ABR533_04060 [Desulfonatronovibrio sp.]